MDPSFSIHHGERTIVLTGELDVATVPYFRAALVEHEAETCTVDLGGVSFVDSAGLRSLLEARALHASLRFVNPSEQLRRLVEITGTAPLLFENAA